MFNVSRGAHFSMGGFVLTVCNDGYLVEVRPESVHPVDCEQTSCLPDWVFHSAHAIWLTEENAPLNVRAAKGERIRRRLLKKAEIH